MVWKMDASKQKDLYFVAVKLLLRDGSKLLITHDIFGEWDLPGGRIRADEFNKPLESVIDRKINEELGPEVKFELGGPTVFFRVERIEYVSKERAKIFAVGYEAKYLDGEIKLGKNHDRMEWVDINLFQPEKYFTGGWLRGIEEYLSRL